MIKSLLQTPITHPGRIMNFSLVWFFVAFLPIQVFAQSASNPKLFLGIASQAIEDIRVQGYIVQDMSGKVLETGSLNGENIVMKEGSSGIYIIT